MQNEGIPAIGGWGNLESENPAPEEEIINSCPDKSSLSFYFLCSKEVNP